MPRWGRRSMHRDRRSNSIPDGTKPSWVPYKDFPFEIRSNDRWTRRQKRTAPTNGFWRFGSFSYPIPIHSKQILTAFSQTASASPRRIPATIMPPPKSSASTDPIRFFRFIPDSPKGLGSPVPTRLSFWLPNGAPRSDCRFHPQKP